MLDPSEPRLDEVRTSGATPFLDQSETVPVVCEAEPDVVDHEGHCLPAPVRAEDASLSVPQENEEYAPGATSSTDQVEVAAATREATSYAVDHERDWLADTGCKKDLIPAAAIVGREKMCVDGNPTKFSTANGITEPTRKQFPIYIDGLNAPAFPYVLKKTPPVISIGRRCQYEGYWFCWPPRHPPFFVDPKGTLITLTVDGCIPYCRPSDRDTRRYNLNDGPVRIGSMEVSLGKKGGLVITAPVGSEPCKDEDFLRFLAALESGSSTDYVSCGDGDQSDWSDHPQEPSQGFDFAELFCWPTDAREFQCAATQTDDCNDASADERHNDDAVSVHDCQPSHHAPHLEVGASAPTDDGVSVHDCQPSHQAPRLEVGAPAPTEDVAPVDEVLSADLEEYVGELLVDHEVAGAPPLDGGVVDDGAEARVFVDDESDDDELVVMEQGTEVVEFDWAALLHQLLHSPPDIKCDGCFAKLRQMRKIARKGFARDRILCNFGDIVTCDLVFMTDGTRTATGYHGYRCAFVIFDLALGFWGFYPCVVPSSSLVRLLFLNFAGREYLWLVYSDNMKEIISACNSLSIPWEGSLPGVKQTNGRIERAIGISLSGIRVLCCNAGLPACFWPLAGPCYVFFENTTSKRGNPSPYEQRHGCSFTGVRVPFGAQVWFKPSPAV